MSRVKRMAVLALLTLSLGIVQAAPRYVSVSPLAQEIKTPVGAVTSGPATVPVITWGADIRTIHANGNSANTASGSLFDQAGLHLKLVREDSFKTQVENYLAGRSPYLRGTLGMIGMATDLLSKDPRTKPIIIYQLSESAGGDALVVKSGIDSAKDLKGKTVALQAYGPHVDYLGKVLADAGLSFTDVKLKWLPDLTGTDNTPMAALYEKDVDAAMVIIPDALALTSGGTVGTGAEESVRGARILVSTKTANRIIADVYAVRADYLKSNRKEVEAFVHGLLKAEEAAGKLVADKVSRPQEYGAMMRAAAKILLDSESAVSDAEALYADAEHMDYNGNVRFFTDSNYPRNLSRRDKEIQASFKQIGLSSGRAQLEWANWDFQALRSGLTTVAAKEAPRFDKGKVATVVAKKQQQGTLAEGELFSFEVFFEPNQNSFPAEMYQESFERVINLASTYGGALITVEGHSDPLGYLRQKKANAPQAVLTRVTQSAKNLSLTRATAVRDAVIGYAQAKHITMDKSQFAVVGHGIAMPRNGMCGSDPCAPKTEQQWRDNMRVVFRVIPIEAESDVFNPL